MKKLDEILKLNEASKTERLIDDLVDAGLKTEEGRIDAIIEVLNGSIDTVRSKLLK